MPRKARMEESVGRVGPTERAGRPWNRSSARPARHRAEGAGRAERTPAALATPGIRNRAFPATPCSRLLALLNPGVRPLGGGRAEFQALGVCLEAEELEEVAHRAPCLSGLTFVTYSSAVSNVS